MVATEPLLDMSMWMNRLQSDQAAIRDRVDGLEEGTQETNRRLGIVEFKVDELTKFTTRWYEEDQKRFEAIDQRFEAIDQRFEAMDQKIDQRFSELKDLLVDALKRKN